MAECKHTAAGSCANHEMRYRQAFGYYRQYGTNKFQRFEQTKRRATGSLKMGPPLVTGFLTSWPAAKMPVTNWSRAIIHTGLFSPLAISFELLLSQKCRRMEDYDTDRIKIFPRTLFELVYKPSLLARLAFSQGRRPGWRILRYCSTEEHGGLVMSRDLVCGIGQQQAGILVLYEKRRFTTCMFCTYHTSS